MTLKDIAKKLATAVPTVPNIIQILSEGLDQATAGSTVEVTQVVSSGTKIATIQVDEESTDLYAPSALHTYSSTEHVIGKWIDGSDLYEKTIVIDNPTHGDWTEIISDSNINIIGYVNSASYSLTQAGEITSIDFFANANVYGRSLIYDNGNSMKVEYYNSYGTLSKYIVTIQYTKTTT